MSAPKRRRTHVEPRFVNEDIASVRDGHGYIRLALGLVLIGGVAALALLLIVAAGIVRGGAA